MRRVVNVQARHTILIANPSADVYGSDLQMLESIDALVRAGHRVIVAIPADGQLVPRITARGGEVEFVRFPVLRRANQSPAAFLGMIGTAIAAVPRLIRYVRRLAPDAVYVNTVTLPWWLLSSRLSRKPTLCHLHEAERTDSALVRRALVMPLRLAHAVIVISRSTMEAMVEADPGLQKLGHLVYNGVPQPPEDPRPATRESPLRVISVGRLSPRKAPHLALDAVGSLRTKGYDVTIELAGTPFEGYEWYVDQLRRRADEPDLAGAVEFSGYCSPIWPHLAGADLVVQPSLREPFGNAVVEAQYSLRPVVATDALGHTESITDGETGLLVPAEDVGALAAALARLIDDADLASRLAERARSEAVRRFSVERYGAEIVALVDEVIARHRGGRAR